MTILNHLEKNQNIAIALHLGKIKSAIDNILPEHLTLQFSLSINKNLSPVILVNNSVWLIQLRQYEKIIADAIQNHSNQIFSDKKIIWKITLYSN